MKDTTRHGRLLQRLVGQPVTESVSWLSSARSFWLSILEGAVSQGSSGNAAGKEGARDVASLKASSGGSPAQEVQPVLGRRSGLGGAGQRENRVAGTDAVETDSAARGTSSTGAEAVLPSRGPVEMAPSPSRAQWRTTKRAERSAGRRMRCSCSASPIERPPTPRARPPVNPISSSSADRR